MASSRSAGTAGYEYALAYQSAFWPEAKMTRNDGTTITIYVPQFTGYTLPPLGFEQIGSGMITHEIITGTTSVHVFSGVRTLTLYGRTATYTGTFFDLLTTKSDEDLQTTPYTIVIDIIHDSFKVDIVTDAVKRQAFINAVLASNRLASHFGYDLAMAQQRQGFPTGNLFRNSASRVTITVPAFPNYAQTAHGSEVIKAVALPALCLDSGVDLTLQTGATSVTVVGRTAQFGGTFFSITDKLDDHIRSTETFVVSIALTKEKFAWNVLSDTVIRQDFIDAVLGSNKAKTTPGYENAFAKMREGYDAALLNFTDSTNTSMTIQIPQFTAYIAGRLPEHYNNNELIQAIDILFYFRNYVHIW